MSSAPRYFPRYTVEDYRQWGGDWQLIDGVAIAMTPSPFGRHERIVANCVHEFMTSIEREGCDYRVYAGLDWIVGSETVVRPDVMVVCGEQPTRHLERPPDLVVEILSPSTSEQDSTIKRRIYQEQGVSTYVMIDSADNSLQVLRLPPKPAATDYETIELAGLSSIRLPGGCRLDFDPVRLLR